MKAWTKHSLSLLTLFIFSMVVVVACDEDGGGDEVDALQSSRAYKGHETDRDVNNLVSVYPHILGTRLDDCQTCHRGETFTYEKNGELASVFKNACDYCHLLIHPDDRYNEPGPASYAETLNTYGAAYLDGGATTEALQAIGGEDSDGDGATNEDEIADLKYPGDPESKPGQDPAPTRAFSLDDLKALSSHEQFLLANSHKQQFDDYANYRGVRMIDLLESAGVDVSAEGFDGITVIAPDGYMKDFGVDQIAAAFPPQLYYAGFDTATLGADCGFVQYPDSLPEGLVSGGEIQGEAWLMMAYERDGATMETSSLDPTSGKINGEGPYRVILPQATPGMPDRGSKYSPTECGDGHDYDDAKNHNAGDMVRGVIAVRVNPLPQGYEDFDYKYGGWAHIDSQSLIVYGFGVSTTE
jgi:hypothetical protein